MEKRLSELGKKNVIEIKYTPNGNLKRYGTVTIEVGPEERISKGGQSNEA